MERRHSQSPKGRGCCSCDERCLFDHSDFPLKSIRKFEEFIAAFLKRAAARFADQGGQLDSENQTVIVLSRSDRSLIGTMNEAKFILGNRIFGDLEGGGDIDWDRVEGYMNEVLYSRIEYDRPSDRLRKLLLS